MPHYRGPKLSMLPPRRSLHSMSGDRATEEDWNQGRKHAFALQIGYFGVLRPAKLATVHEDDS